MGATVPCGDAGVRPVISRKVVDTRAAALHEVLLHAAADRSDPATQAVAGVLAGAFARHGFGLLPLPGLDAEQTRKLLEHWFRGADRKLGLQWLQLASAARAEPRLDEVDDVAALLVDTADPQRDADAVRWLAHVVAVACLGERHLWQDLLLPSRKELSLLLETWFPMLAARNVHNMKWKKFFYKQLCERAELMICKSPSCAACTDYAVCFGPEDDPA